MLIEEDDLKVEDVIRLVKLEGVMLKLDTEGNLQIISTNGEEVREPIVEIIYDWAQDLVTYLESKNFLDS
jgi:hypothetical protein